MERKTPTARSGRGSGFHLADEAQASTENQPLAQCAEAGTFWIGDRIGGLLFAYVQPTRFTGSAVSASRLGAALKPFQSAAEARAALEAAGAHNVRKLAR